MKFMPNWSIGGGGGGGGGVAAALFLLRHLKNFENEEMFLCLKIAENDMAVNSGLKRRYLDIKTFFKLTLNLRGLARTIRLLSITLKRL